MFKELKTNAKSLFLGDSSIFLAATGYVLGFMLLTHFGIPFASLLLFPLIMGMIARMATIHSSTVVDQPSVLSYYLNPENLWRSILTFLIPNLLLLIIAFTGIVLFSVLVVFAFINGFISLLLLPLVLFIVVFFVYKSIQYTMVPYIMVEKKEAGIFQAIRESKDFVQGRMLRIILLNFSFIGWAILNFFTFGFMNIWLIPYYRATMLEFYRSERNS